MVHHVTVLVFLKEGVLDTQGKAVLSVLLHAGHSDVRDVRIGKYIQLKLESPTREEALNGIIEEYTVELSGEDDA
jgi:phosphoribosylformylglycinamidine synthase PurS subunit